jgi:hypothetical protein
MAVTMVLPGKRRARMSQAASGKVSMGLNPLENCSFSQAWLDIAADLVVPAIAAGQGGEVLDLAGLPAELLDVAGQGGEVLDLAGLSAELLDVAGQGGEVLDLAGLPAQLLDVAGQGGELVDTRGRRPRPR